MGEWNAANPRRGSRALWLAGDLHHYAVSGLEPGSWHQVRVVAVNASGQSDDAAYEITLPTEPRDPTPEATEALPELAPAPPAPPGEAASHGQAAPESPPASGADLRGTMTVGDINGAIAGILFDYPGRAFSTYDSEELKRHRQVLDSLGEGEEYPCPLGSGAGFSDISTGTPVTVRDAGGSIVGMGALEGGTLSTDGCTFTFGVQEVPPSDFYSVEVSHRGPVNYSSADLDDSRWVIHVKLG